MAMGVVKSSRAAIVGRSSVKDSKSRRSSRVVCGAASPAASYSWSGLAEQYQTLRVNPGASEKEVKKAFRQLALQVNLPFLNLSTVLISNYNRYL